MRINARVYDLKPGKHGKIQARIAVESEHGQELRINERRAQLDIWCIEDLSEPPAKLKRHLSHLFQSLDLISTNMDDHDDIRYQFEGTAHYRLAHVIQDNPTH